MTLRLPGLDHLLEHLPLLIAPQLRLAPADRRRSTCFVLRTAPYTPPWELPPSAIRSTTGPWRGRPVTKKT